MSSFVAELRNNLTVPEIGGKAHSLSVLLNNGFNVPQGFVITSSAFFDFLRQNGSLEEVQELASEMTGGNFKEKSAEAREAILKGEIPKSMASEIDGFLNRLVAKYVSIRSSAASEDSLRSSFAGLFDTFLNIKVETPLVLDNVKKCWASLFNERAVAYQIRKGDPHLEGMAVIVQEMIPAEISGTAFTAHPDKKDADMIVIESSWGLGEAIVSGKVTPDMYVVDKKGLTVISRKLGRKKVMVRAQENGVSQIDTPIEKKNTFSLNNDSIENLCRICLRIEKLFSHPQDIEWCVHSNKIWILQSRSITNL
jgi:phosphoenolpyruvate synthase/pyruvate phosphate dikinase